MIGHYFDKTEHKGVLYIPRSVIVINDDREPGAYDINYCPENIKNYDLIWNSGNTIEKRRILGNAMNCLELDIKEDLIKKFQNFCWGTSLLDIVNAYICAGEIFELAKEEAEMYEGIK